MGLPLVQEVYYYEDEQGNRVLDEELMLEEFKEKMERLKNE